MKYPFGNSGMVVLIACAGALFAACDDDDHVITSTPAVVQGNGLVVEEMRPVNGARRLVLKGVGDLYIEQGAQESLLVQAEENLLEYLHTDSQSGELVIWKDGVTLLNTRPIEYHLTVTDLERLALTGAGAIRGSNFDVGPLEISLTGVGTVELVDLSASSLEVASSGVGQVILTGSVQQQTIELKGMGGYDGRDLASDEADVLITYGGSATVRVTSRLGVVITGSGSVYYIGDPVLETSVTGSGEVVKIDG